MKKLIPALCMLLVSACLLGTSTFAWFSMNTTVTATGMTVRASAGSNLEIGSIGATDTDATSASYKRAYITTSSATTLQPVSTADGLKYYATDSTKVDTNGKATTFGLVTNNKKGGSKDNAFGEYYTTGEPFVEYVLSIKASNPTDADQELQLSELDLTYGSNESAGDAAFRVAVFAEKATLDASSNPVYKSDYSKQTLVTILAPTGADYFTKSTTGSKNQAVAGVSSTNMAEVSKLNDEAVIGTVTAKEVNYFRVIIRLWLEGEDKTCTNDTFVDLSADWGLDAKFVMTSSSSDSGVTVLGYTKSSTIFGIKSGTAGDTTKAVTVDGATYNLYGTVYSTAATAAAGMNVYSISNSQVENVTYYTVVYDVKLVVGSPVSESKTIGGKAKTLYKYTDADSSSTVYYTDGAAAVVDDGVVTSTVYTLTGSGTTESPYVLAPVTDKVFFMG